jgi:hypothetical protein
MPHWVLVEGRRPNRPPVIEYAARCAIQMVRTSHRGTAGDVFCEVVADMSGLLGFSVSTM